MSHLHAGSRQFLTALESGNASTAARRLQHWLSENPAASLQAGMRSSGLENFEHLVLEVATQQSELIGTLERHGHAEAAKSARQILAQAYLDRFGRLVEHLPCDAPEAETASAGNSDSAGAGGGSSDSPHSHTPARRSLAETATASLLPFLLALGAFFLIERLSRTHVRRSKRHPCTLPCILSVGKAAYRAQFVDVSEKGGKIRLQQEVQAGPGALVDVADLRLKSRIVWSTQNYAGIAFSPPLSAAKLDALCRWQADAGQTEKLAEGGVPPG